ncbi:peptide chain release factor N(5)-glutamine methyltransferase [Desulfoluna spongiiphila]|uniref:Release factor glutamine methyltransferase n=1 Tax=Desulfoluna spongiiphila TaxID=419481 RepID=A0A1G5AL09_9BACT|nr:peptide chain release factor N(5)-glutamine methyltransferase [Desulfoluna spongiiphila]SCX78608.1 release factor glutamine methyltransferase [Desulfoluna spongiiphila]
MNKPSDPLFSVSVSIGEMLAEAARLFDAAGVDAPLLAADLLMMHLLDTGRAGLVLRKGDIATASLKQGYEDLVRRRLDREPIAYIVGETGFWDLDLEVVPGVLVPRPDTETLVEAALEVLCQADGGLRIVDLGTGSGAIALSLAKACPQHVVFATDRSATALDVARGNARKNNVADRVTFVQGVWFDPFVGDSPVFDVVVSNPPYIPTADIDLLEPEVAVFEPRLALDGDADGLRDLSLIISGCRRHLKPGGWVFLEMGWDQREAVRSLLEVDGLFESILFFDDYAGNNRAVRARRKA